MLYWDTSALFAYVVTESHSEKLRELVGSQKTSSSYTSMITPVEFESAIRRGQKDHTLDLLEADRASLFGVEFRKKSFLISMDHNVLDIALHLQKIYDLRPSDAIQLASARLGTDNPSQVRFLCLDQKLIEAARREGFQV